jgi:cytochrome bd-type quinol oxidase subunit 1
MHYPFWYVPGLTAPMWIAIVAVLHVYVAMYAVGGSILLALQTGIAYRTGNREYLSYLRDHTWFFVLITVVYGALTGVGIWWTIGLASPLATEELIHVFMLGWAMEYVMFLVEIVSAFVFFYYWGKLADRTHLQVGWIYAGSAFASLVIITAITAFMLNTGNWSSDQGFWQAMANPQALPQIAARTGGSVLLGALYFFPVSYTHLTLPTTPYV